jgi:hypothetical protein
MTDVQRLANAMRNACWYGTTEEIDSEAARMIAERHSSLSAADFVDSQIQILKSQPCKEMRDRESWYARYLDGTYDPRGKK